MGAGRAFFPFLIGAMVGSGYLARKLGISLPELKERFLERMKGMMSEKMGGMDMCKQMMEGFGKSHELAAFATPELRELFEEWVKKMEAAILEFVAGKKSVNLLDIAAQFKLSLESTVYLVNRLALQGKLKFGTIEPID